MENLQLKRLIEVGIGGETTSDTNEKYLIKLERQLELEENMHTAGILRYQRETERAKSKGREHTTSYGLQMLKSAIDPVSAAIKEFVENSYKGGRGRVEISAMILREVNFDAAAYLALRSILDSITLQHTLTKAAMRISSCIEDQVKFTKFEQECQPLYEVVKTSLKHKTSYIHKHLIMTRYMNKASIQWEHWKNADKVHLGTKLISLIIQSTGFIHIVERRKGKNNTPKFVEATPKTLKWIEEKAHKSGILNPLFYSTIIPPQKWIHPFKGGYHSPLIRQMTMIKTRNNNYLV